MIDTVALKIEQSATETQNGQMKMNWEVTNSDMFEHRDVENYEGCNWHCWNKKQERASAGITEYLPHVEIRNLHYSFGGWEYYLYVKFSVPKILYGNNLFEVRNSDFNSVCQRLRDKLDKMGISIDVQAIQQGVVRQVHYGHNIVCYGVPIPLVIRRLASARPPKACMNVAKVFYLMADDKQGEQITFHNKQEELCFYDKYLELMNAKENPDLLAWLSRRPDLADILRVEVRLNKLAAVQREFKRKEVFFQDAFNEQVAKDSIMKRWQTVYQSLAAVAPEDYAPEYLLMLAKRNRRFSFQGVKDIVFMQALVSSLGKRATDVLLKSMCSKKEYYALLNCWKRYKAPLLPAQYDYIVMIDAALRSMTWFGPHPVPTVRRMLSAAPMKYEGVNTVKDSAKYLKVHERTLQQMCKSKAIGHLRIGRQYRLRKEDILALMCVPKVG